MIHSDHSMTVYLQSDDTGEWSIQPRYRSQEVFYYLVEAYTYLTNVLNEFCRYQHLHWAGKLLRNALKFKMSTILFLQLLTHFSYAKFEWPIKMTLKANDYILCSQIFEI